MNYGKIHQLIDQNKVEKMKFYKAIKLTHAGFARMMKEKTLRVDTLELIAQYFNVPITYFFEIIPSNKDKEILELFRENRELRQKIETLEKKEDVVTGHGIPKLTGQKK